jgi:hypothetical protein
MAFHKFKTEDVVYNQVKTHPQCSFSFYDRKIFFNNRPEESGSFTGSVGCTPPGAANLYEMNVDRNIDQTGFISPFVVKGGNYLNLKGNPLSPDGETFKAAPYGTAFTGSYPLSASLSSDRYPEVLSTVGNWYSERGKVVSALENSFNQYVILNPQFAYSSSYGKKSEQEMRIISIPSIFYGSSIKKGSVSLKFIITGSIIGELVDDKKDGVLRQTEEIIAGAGTPVTSDSGSVAGFVLYDHGFIVLTGSWPIGDNLGAYGYGSSVLEKNPRWIEFGHTGSNLGYLSGDENLPNTSFQMDFEGVNYIPNITMFANAPKGQVNTSNNPTAKTYNPLKNFSVTTGSLSYGEPPDQTIKSIVSSSYTDPAPTFEKTVFIEQIGIYDEDKNLIAIAKLAKPVRKRDTDDITFKLKVDF